MFFGVVHVFVLQFLCVHWSLDRLWATLYKTSVALWASDEPFLYIKQMHPGEKVGRSSTSGGGISKASSMERRWVYMEDDEGK
jgi:hypothetical protein